MTGVYLAYPLDQANPKSFRSFVIEASAWARAECSWVFDPGAAFSVTPGCELTPDIRAITGEALDRAGVVIASLPAGVVSIGVPMEVDRAVRAGKVVLVVSDAPSWLFKFEEPNVLVVPEWGGTARRWLSTALRRVSEDLSGDGPALMPVVVDKDGEEPRRGYADDAGLDLVVSEDRWVLPREFVDIPCGIRVQLPEWSWGMITGRSSTLRKRGLMVNQGVIDAGFRGPLFAGVWNLTDDPVQVLKGERIAQLLIMYNGTRLVKVQQVDRLEAGSRGEAGFGSTGA